MSEFLACPPVRRLPVASLRLDPDAPRPDTAPLSASDPLLVSIKALGVLTPLVVVRAGRHRYLVVAGRRRYRRARKLGLTTLPCQVHARLSPGRLAEVRLALQVTIEPWTAAEHQRAVETREAKTSGAMTPLPPAARDLLRRLPPSYRLEFRRCRPKLRALGSFSVDRVIRNLLARVNRHVITNAQEFRVLGKLVASRQHDRDLLTYLKTPRMSVKELELSLRPRRASARSD